jgi:hypothetical protein
LHSGFALIWCTRFDEICGESWLVTELAPSIKRIGETIFGLVPDRPRIGLRRIVRNQRERRRLERADLVVIAHPKSGSTC